MSVISVEHLTQDYGHGRGVFDVSLEVEKGECYGLLGPNGAGKTTTIRHMMGFFHPQEGSVRIEEEDAWKRSAALPKRIGYIPGEVTIPSNMTGKGSLRMMEQMRGVKNEERLHMLQTRFDLDPDVGIQQMSPGVKRKLAVVKAFLHDPDILILDEPTSGLDPVMQEEFIQFVEEEKARGKTVFLSSHIFHEADAVCDRIAILRAGRIASEFTSATFKESRDRIYGVAFEDKTSWEAFISLSYHFTSKNRGKMRARVQLPERELPRLIADLSPSPWWTL